MPDAASSADLFALSTLAHVKMLMHALKYHHASVNGFLLVEDGSRNKTKAGKEESGRVEFVDAIPLFHLGHGLTPMIEVALLQVSSYCKEHGLLIGGLYFANKYFNDSTPDVFCQKIAEKILEQNSSAVLLVLDNMGLASAVQEQADAESLLSLHIPSDGKWKQKSGLLKLESPALAFDCINELILNQGLQLQLKDFDNHLDDISNDWGNKTLSHKIQAFIASSAAGD